MDGHTAEGSWIVKLELSEDQVQQIIRTMEWAKMVDSHEDNPPDSPQRIDFIAHRAFLQELLEILYKAIEEQSIHN